MQNIDLTEALKMRICYGIKFVPSVHIPPTRPRYQLDPKFEWCTPAFRAEYNEWLRQWFGEETLAILVPPSFSVSSPFAWAGSGCGYILANPAVIQRLERVLPPMSAPIQGTYLGWWAG